jgi:hypothetical protein
MKLTTPLHASLRACCTGRRFVLSLLLLLLSIASAGAKCTLRRTLDSRHPMWLHHIDVWNAADPQKIIDLNSADISPMSSSIFALLPVRTEKNVYKMRRTPSSPTSRGPASAASTISGSTCQPASGGHTHIQDDDLETFEYFFKTYKKLPRWNYAEQFGASTSKRPQLEHAGLALGALAKPRRDVGALRRHAHRELLRQHLVASAQPVGQLKRNARLYEACKANPEKLSRPLQVHHLRQLVHKR